MVLFVIMLRLPLSTEKRGLNENATHQSASCIYRFDGSVQFWMRTCREEITTQAVFNPVYYCHFMLQLIRRSLAVPP